MRYALGNFSILTYYGERQVMQFTNKKILILLLLLLIYIVTLCKEKNKNKDIPLLQAKIKSLESSLSDAHARLGDNQVLQKKIESLESSLKDAHEEIEKMSQTIASYQKETREKQPAKDKSPIEERNLQPVSLKTVEIKKDANTELSSVHPTTIQAAPNVKKKYTIQKQDYIWKIIRQEYQTEKIKDETEKKNFEKKIFDIIMEENSLLKGNPDNVKPGMVIDLPDEKNIQKISTQKAQIQTKFIFPTYHRVKPGDTLYDLARIYYNTHQKWVDILEANPNLKSPKLIYGSYLKIP